MDQMINTENYVQNFEATKLVTYKSLFDLLFSLRFINSQTIHES